MSDAEGDTEDETGEEGRNAVVLDVLRHGRTEDDRPQYQKQPLVYALGVEDFQLLELVVDKDIDLAIGDTIDVTDTEDVEVVHDAEYEDLSSGAQSELEYAVEDIVAANEGRFVDYYNEAQPITLRLHQLNLLPGIGKKLRNNILDERERRPFQNFEDVEARVDGLHHPREVLVERIMEELREEDLKYRTFRRSDDE
jgi:putative nucleotide binding protein